MDKKNKCLFLLASLLFLSIYLTGKQQAVAQKQPQIPQRPQRIVSLSLSADEMLLSLVEKERLLALTYLATDGGISNVVAEAKQCKNFVRADAEMIIDLQPDLVVASGFTQPQLVAVLRQAGIPVLVYPLSQNLAEIEKNILLVAETVGEKAKGNQLVQKMKQQLRPQPAKRLRCLYYGLTGDIQGAGTQFDELLRLAGLINAAAEIGIVGRAQIDREKLLEIDPDVIFMPTWRYQRAKDAQQAIQVLLQDPALSSLKAVREKRIFPLLDKHITCSSQYIVEGWRDIVLWTSGREEK